MSLEDFPAFARLHGSEIRQALLDGTYKPQAVRRVSIPKPNGGGRFQAFCIFIVYEPPYTTFSRSWS
jgi:hypothetical protein